MSELSKYVLNQIRCQLTADTKLRPVIQQVTDKGTKVCLTFSVGKNQQVSVTASDLYLASLNHDLSATLTLPRQKYLQKLTREVTAGIREDIVRDEEYIDFAQPISDEVAQKAKQLAMELTNRPDFAMFANVDFISSVGEPLLVYHVIKNIIPLMTKKNLIVPEQLKLALKNPQDYLNPYFITEKENQYNEDVSESDSLLLDENDEVL